MEMDPLTFSFQEKDSVGNPTYQTTDSAYLQYACD